jgi:prephenate dehydratase
MRRNDSSFQNLQLSSKYRYSSVATLGNHLTCSNYAAKNYCRTSSIKLYDSFEEAATAVKEGIAQAMFVPGAYPNIRYFIMDDFLSVSETEVLQIPALVLAGKFIKQPDKIKRIYLHPAPESLLAEVETKYEETVFVSSNPNACIEVLADNNNSIAITNLNCAEYFDLKVYKILRSGIFMPFVLFVRA